jgi:hypothetical protein
MDSEALKFLDAREKKLLADIERATRDLEGIRGAKAAILASASPQVAIDDSPKLSVNEMVRQCLAGHFQTGATVNQLHQFFKTRWNRQLSKAGLSVTLSRMKDEGELRLENQVWLLSSSTP